MIKIVKIEQLENGAHLNQRANFKAIPKGYALIPEDLETPNFPFGDITVEEIEGVITVTSWTPREIPIEPEPEPELTVQDDTDAMLIDHEYRLTMLELGVEE